MARRRLGWALAMALGVLPARASAAALDPILEGVRWGEGSAALAQAFGTRALRLAHPIEFGDSYVDVALYDQLLGGYAFTVYFHMDKRTRGLKRVMLERQRHGANPLVFRAVRDTLVTDYGVASCNRPAEKIWQVGGVRIRAVFSDTTMEAAEGCTSATNGPCGATGQLYIQITPGGSGGDPCTGG